MEAIYDSDLVVTDVIIHSRENDDIGECGRVQCKDSEPLTQIVVVVRKREKFESMYVARSCRRLDQLAQLFEPRVRPLKTYTYMFCGSSESRQSDKVRKLFLAALLQTFKQTSPPLNRHHH